MNIKKVLKKTLITTPIIFLLFETLPATAHNNPPSSPLNHHKPTPQLQPLLENWNTYALQITQDETGKNKTLPLNINKRFIFNQLLTQENLAIGTLNKQTKQAGWRPEHFKINPQNNKKNWSITFSEDAPLDSAIGKKFTIPLIHSYQLNGETIQAQYVFDITNNNPKTIFYPEQKFTKNVALAPKYKEINIHVAHKDTQLALALNSSLPLGLQLKDKKIVGQIAAEQPLGAHEFFLKATRNGQDVIKKFIINVTPAIKIHNTKAVTTIVNSNSSVKKIYTLKVPIKKDVKDIAIVTPRAPEMSLQKSADEWRLVMPEQMKSPVTLGVTLHNYKYFEQTLFNDLPAAPTVLAAKKTAEDVSEKKVAPIVASGDLQGEQMCNFPTPANAKLSKDSQPMVNAFENSQFTASDTAPTNMLGEVESLVESDKALVNKKTETASKVEQVLTDKVVE